MARNEGRKQELRERRWLHSAPVQAVIAKYAEEWQALRAGQVHAIKPTQWVKKDCKYQIL